MSIDSIYLRWKKISSHFHLQMSKSLILEIGSNETITLLFE